MQEIIIAIISTGLFTELVRFLIDLKTRKNGISQTLTIASKAQSCLDSLVAYTAGSRASLIIATNGGNVPKLDESWYVTIFLGSSNPPLKPIKDDFQKREVDYEYKKILTELYQKKRIELRTENLTGLLSNVYAPNNITHSDVFMIDSGANWLMYLSVNYVNHEENDQLQTETLNLYVNELRNSNIKKALKNVEINNRKLV